MSLGGTMMSAKREDSSRQTMTAKRQRCTMESITEGKVEILRRWTEDSRFPRATDVVLRGAVAWRSVRSADSVAAMGIAFI
jgi:hypothetical protein